MIGFPFDNMRSRSFVIEPFIRDDAPHLAALHALTFRQPWSDDDFHALAGRRQCVSGSSLGRRGTEKRWPAASLWRRLVLDEAEILTIAVAPRAQRKGLGHALMDATLRHLHNARASMLFLEVDELNIRPWRFIAGSVSSRSENGLATMKRLQDARPP